MDSSSSAIKKICENNKNEIEVNKEEEIDILMGNFHGYVLSNAQKDKIPKLQEILKHQDLVVINETGCNKNN